MGEEEMNRTIAALIALGTLVAGCDPMGGGMGLGGGMGGGAGSAGTAGAGTAGAGGTGAGSTVVSPGEVVPTDGPGNSSTVDAASGGSDEGDALDNLDG
jgi:hypothetical protein